MNSAVQLARQLGKTIPNLDRDAICERLAQPGAQFVKWDCRSGNAALDTTARLRWFDFEYSGLRHGAEDFAWLIGDEVWPLKAPKMLDIVSDAFDPGAGHPRDVYLSYLALFTTFHTVQRIVLIVGDVMRRGWSSQSWAVRYDKIDTHPLMGIKAAETAAYCSDRNDLTRPLVPLFDAIAVVFADTMRDNVRKLAG